MSRRPARGRRTRLRPTLTLTLALAAASTAVAVAVSSYYVVRDERLTEATDSAVDQSRFNLLFAGETLGASVVDDDIETVLQALERRGGFDIVARVSDRTFQTSVSISASAIPTDLVPLVERNRLAVARREVSGASYVIVGGRLPQGGQQLWFFFPLEPVLDDLRTLRDVLAASALAMVVVSAAVGALAARALLRPIGRARDAAHRLEAGDLTTRLPDAGSDEFAELSRSFNAMAVALERTVEDLRRAEGGHRRFVADVSHELRTPVTALATAAELLEAELDELPDRAARSAQILVDEARRLRELVEDLMEISRLDAGAASFEPDLIDLRRLVLGAVADRGWDDDVRTDRVERALVRGDRRRLDRVLTNLLDNALRHGAPPVEVTVGQVGDRVVVEVTDHGPGIPDEHLPHVFDRFYKADTARQRSASSGLGLAIASENVTLHHGTIEAANAPGGGARFVVTLPAAGDVAELLRDGDEVVNHEGEALSSPSDRPEGSSR